jgi:hypothetical protein
MCEKKFVAIWFVKEYVKGLTQRSQRNSQRSQSLYIEALYFFEEREGNLIAFGFAAQEFELIICEI